MSGNKHLTCIFILKIKYSNQLFITGCEEPLPILTNNNNNNNNNNINNNNNNNNTPLVSSSRLQLKYISRGCSKVD